MLLSFSFKWNTIRNTHKKNAWFWRWCTLKSVAVVHQQRHLDSINFWIKFVSLKVSKPPRSSSCWRGGSGCVRIILSTNVKPWKTAYWLEALENASQENSWESTVHKVWGLKKCGVSRRYLSALYRRTCTFWANASLVFCLFRHPIKKLWREGRSHTPARLRRLSSGFGNLLSTLVGFAAYGALWRVYYFVHWMVRW